jgi:membrane-associated PAP2 superfamily phosphatase
VWFWTPVLLAFTASALVRLFHVDVKLAHWFWSDGIGWWLKNHPIVKVAYRFGSIPCVVSASLAFAGWLASFWICPLRPARRFALYMSLALVLGPVVLVNTALKGHFGRPRPRDVIEFGGGKSFRELGEGAFTGTGRSFPSGHAAAAFFWIAPAVYFRSRSRTLACALAALALAHGGLMSFARMAQGAHWFSDTLWSAALVYMAAYFVWYILSSITHPFAQWDARRET